MILNSGGVLVQWRPFSHAKTVCLASPPATAEQLRQQLDNLHKEADNTRAKGYPLVDQEAGTLMQHLASNARLRLIRLSEAVENLRRQAAISVQTGKENDARELLFQKKKVMQAMEKLKSRIEVFVELSAKLNGLISKQESRLISNMALDLDVSEREAPSPIRFVSPAEEKSLTSDDDHYLDMVNLELNEDQEDIHVHNESKSEESFRDRRLTGADMVQVPREVSTFDDLMNHVDQQLNIIEQELTFVRYSNILSGYKEKPEYSKVHHVTEILAYVSLLNCTTDNERSVKLKNCRDDHDEEL